MPKQRRPASCSARVIPTPASTTAAPLAQREPGQRAVHRARVEVAEAEPLREPAGDGALAGARRPVDATIIAAVADRSRARRGRRSRGSLPPPPSAPSTLDALRERKPGDGAEHRDPVVAARVDPCRPADASGRRGSGSRPRAPSTWTPIARSASTTVSIRSVSLARSSSAPRTRLSPCAQRGERARRAAARRRAAAPRPRRSSSRSARPSAPRGRRPARRRPGGGCRTPTRAPIRSSTSSRPGAARVEVDAVDGELASRGCSVAATMNGAAEEKSPGTSTSPSARLAPADRRSTELGRRSTLRAGGLRASARCGRGSARLDDGRPARRAEPGEQDRRLHLRARHGQLVVDRVERPPVDRRAAGGRRSSRSARPCAERLGDAPHRPRARATRRPSSVKRARPGRRGCPRAGARACPRCRSRSARPAAAARAGRRRARAACRRPRSSTSTPSARTASIVDLGVAPSGRSRATRVSPSEIAPSRTRTVRDRLVAGDGEWPSSEAAGSTLIADAPADDDDAVALRLEQRRPRAAPRPRPSTSTRQRAAALGRDVVQLEVLDVDPLGAERLRDPGEHARAVGHVHADALQRARVGVGALEHAAPVARPPRRSSGRGSRRRRARAPPRPARSRRRCSASAPRTASALSRKMSTQMRGFAPAMRVMSRSEPPAAASGSWPSTRARAGLVRRARSRARAAGGSSARRAGRARRRRSRPGARRARRRSRARAR